MNKKTIQSDLLSILKEIVKINTTFPPGSSKHFSEFVCKYLKNSGLNIKTYGVDKEKINIVASNYKGLKKSLVFNSHIDTVSPILSEWKSNPFDLKIGNKFSLNLSLLF